MFKAKHTSAHFHHLCSRTYLKTTTPRYQRKRGGEKWGEKERQASEHIISSVRRKQHETERITDGQFVRKKNQNFNWN